MRPCRILEVSGDSVRVAKVTTKDLSRFDHCWPVQFSRRTTYSWLDMRQQRWLPLSDLIHPIK